MPPRITQESVEAAATERTGLTDFGDDFYATGLNVFLNSLDADGPLHESGHAAMSNLIVLRLAARLASRHFLLNNDNDRAGLDRSPVFVIGLPRSGTTLLYNLLSMHPECRAPELWETMDPVPPVAVSSRSNVEQRISGMNEVLHAYNEGLPHLKKIHYFHSAQQVEECSGLLEPTFHSPSLAYFIWGGETYYRWFFEQAPEVVSKAFREYRQMIEILMIGHEKRFWLSKCPLYATCVAEMGEVFKSGKFIVAHRDPREWIPSYCSLLENFQSVYCQPDPLNVGRQAMFFKEQATRAIDLAESTAIANRMLNIDYSKLIENPIQVISDIYKWLGIEISDEYISTIKKWLAQRNPYAVSRVGRHQYNGTKYGLSDDDLSKFAP